MTWCRLRRVAALAVVATCLTPTGQSAAKTTINSDGSTVTLTVPIDLVGAVNGQGVEIGIKDLDTGVRIPVSVFYADAAKVWNDAFSHLPFKGCVSFKLDLQFFPKASGSPTTPGHHRVELSFDPDVRPGFFFPGSTDATADETSPFTSDIAGDWGALDPATVAHEVGHLLGLGDDYIDVKDANGNVTGSKPVPGRSDNSLMRSSGFTNVDQALIDRIGKLVADSGHQLPNCWSGSMTLAGFEKDSAGTVCTDPGTEFSVKFAVASDGTVHGDGSFKGATTRCDPDLFQDQPPGTFTIAGRRDGDQFMLGITYPFTGFLVFAGYWPDNGTLQWTVPVQGTQAHAVITSTMIGGFLPGQVTLTVDLQCSSCETGS